MVRAESYIYAIFLTIFFKRNKLGLVKSFSCLTLSLLAATFNVCFYALQIVWTQQKIGPDLDPNCLIL